MQPSLPYQDFTRSAECLDYKRLGKQRVAAYPNDQMKESELWYVYTKVDNEIIRIQKE